MAEETPTVFGKKATEQIAKTVREVARQMMNPRGQRGRWQNGGTTNRAAVIGSALTSPASSLAVATTCTVYFLLLGSAGTQTVVAGGVTAYNDDPEVTADKGMYCRLEWLNGRWMLYYVGCDVQAALVTAINAL